MPKAVKKTKANHANYITMRQFEQTLLDKEMRFHTMQYTLDMVVVALGRMGFGEKRLNDISKMIDTVCKEYAEEVVADSAEDADMVYSRTSLDRELKQYVGSNFVPYEERYKWRGRDELKGAAK